MGPLTRTGGGPALRFTGDPPPSVLWEHRQRGVRCQVLPSLTAVLTISEGQYALRDLLTGEARWSRSGSAPEEIAGGDRCLVIAAGTRLTCLAARDGSPLASASLPATAASLLLHERGAWVGVDGSVLSFAWPEAKPTWRLPCGEEPVLRLWDGLLLVEDEEGLRCVEPSRGKLLWRAGDEYAGFAAGESGGVIPIQTERGLQGCDLRSGRQSWKLPNVLPAVPPVTVAGGLYAATNDALVIIEPGSGQVKSTTALGLGPDDAPFAMRALGGYILLDTWAGLILACDPGDGSIRWRGRFGQVHGAEAEEGRLVIRSTRPGPSEPTRDEWVITAVSLKTGDRLWEGVSGRLISDSGALLGVVEIEPKDGVMVLKGADV